ncbi:hypothetical protein EV195_102322 [Tenacibaculum skagerrakense]|uniref:DUF1449 family protein n=1 Tax=Tenacibaculum skagerrakense TaxID=186571 RepID=A0A4R2NXU3_9FLAO|nr:OB-fold-containig protein [Tenacibaculum skagerrakense]TCP26980.1 hypothetical protein EV195_102322 [Tenacibaculum skagerrakense]
MTLTDIVFSDVNITLTILLIILLTYWLITMISGIDFDLDMDIDVDLDVDIDADVDIDVDSNIGTGLEGSDIDFHDVANTEVNKEDIVGKRRKPLKWWQVLLIYFNFVGLPFMFTFTIWIFIWWLTTTIITTVTNSYDNTFGFILMIAGFFPSLLATKVFTSPFKNFFRNLNQDGDSATEIAGRKGISLSTISEDKLGRAEIKADGNTLNINIKSLDGKKINYKSQILIIKQSKNKLYYYAQEYFTDSIDINF